MNFTAIDFETANTDRHSICQIGIVVVENGIIVEELDIKVNPKTDYWKFTHVHGITNDMVKHCKDFGRIWPTIKHYIENKLVVAHNGLRFDFHVLDKTLMHYGIEIPSYSKADTYQIFGAGLAILCEAHQIELDHHDALSDSRACAKLYIKHLQEMQNNNKEL